MPSQSAEIDAGGRKVRVSSPERVIFEATETTSALNKLDIVKYYVAVGEAMVRGLSNRPTTLERWPKGVREGMRLSTRTDGRGDAFYQKRMMRGAPNWVQSMRVHFPSGRQADELCPEHIADVAWAAQMGTLTFHPWPVRRADPDRPDELRIDLDPYGDTGFTDAVRIADLARRTLADVGISGFAKTSGKRGIHIYVRIEPRWTFTDVRHAAIGFARELERRTDGVTTKWWKEERGDNIFVDFNQNCRDRTIASAYSIRPVAGAPVSTPVTWKELVDLTDPAVFNVTTVPRRLEEFGDPWQDINQVAHSLEPLLEWWRRDPTEMPYPPEYPKMPGEPKRVQPSKAKH